MNSNSLVTKQKQKRHKNIYIETLNFKTTQSQDWVFCTV